ncbi:MAG: alpha-1,4-glucan--maltose-1-phosphate maltosyltransferase, partial [Acidimicrobiia bacterium]
ELAYSDTADFMRPNFWPNTPDILSGPLRRGTAGAFKMRLALAATLTPSYGIYSGYELAEGEPASEENEEYLNSEKYEIKSRDWESPASLAPYIARLNSARRRHPALRQLSNIRFHHSDTDWILAYSKHTAASPLSPPRLAPDGDDDVVLVVVNLDPHATREDVLRFDPTALGLPADAAFEAHDELTGATYVWEGTHHYVRLSPEEPAHLLHLRRRPG